MQKIFWSHSAHQKNRRKNRDQRVIKWIEENLNKSRRIICRTKEFVVHMQVFDSGKQPKFHILKFNSPIVHDDYFEVSFWCYARSNYEELMFIHKITFFSSPLFYSLNELNSQLSWGLWNYSKNHFHPWLATTRYFARFLFSHFIDPVCIICCHSSSSHRRHRSPHSITPAATSQVEGNKETQKKYSA